MAYSFVAYIDESGDPSCVHPFRVHAGRGGRSHFLSLGAYVVTVRNDRHLVRLRDEIRTKIKPGAQKRDLHFSGLKHPQKIRYCELLSEHRARAITVIFNKSRFLNHNHFTNNPDAFYWYACRFLVERISWLCDDAEPDPNYKRVKLVFSNRGGMTYDNFSSYLRRLRNLNDPKIQIRWQCIDEDLVESRPHGQRAGLQFADGVTSAISAAIEPQPLGVLESRYGLALKPILYRYRTGRISSYGIKVMPGPRAGLSEEQRANIVALCE